MEKSYTKLCVHVKEMMKAEDMGDFFVFLLIIEV